jgi:hypothetical protein
MAAIGAADGLHDPAAVSPEAWMADAERRRSAQVERIQRWEQVPPGSVYRQNEDNHQAFVRTLRADLRQIDHGITLFKMGKGA